MLQLLTETMGCWERPHRVSLKAGLPARHLVCVPTPPQGGGGYAFRMAKQGTLLERRGVEPSNREDFKFRTVAGPPTAFQPA